MERLVIEYYQNKYPNDNLGEKINPLITFNDVFTILQTSPNKIYECIGVHDSLIRERIFLALSKIKNISISVVYELWLSESN